MNNNHKYLKTVKAGYQDTFLDLFTALASLKLLCIHKYIEIQIYI